jgi:hypothetical protein
MNPGCPGYTASVRTRACRQYQLAVALTVAQATGFAKTGNRDVDYRSQSVLLKAVDDVGIDAGGHSLLNDFRIVFPGEQHHRKRCVRFQFADLRQQHVARRIVVNHQQIRLRCLDAFEQIIVGGCFAHDVMAGFQ